MNCMEKRLGTAKCQAVRCHLTLRCRNTPSLRPSAQRRTSAARTAQQWWARRLCSSQSRAFQSLLDSQPEPLESFVQAYALPKNLRRSSNEWAGASRLTPFLSLCSQDGGATRLCWHILSLQLVRLLFVILVASVSVGIYSRFWRSTTGRKRSFFVTLSRSHVRARPAKCRAWVSTATSAPMN